MQATLDCLGLIIAFQTNLSRGLVLKVESGGRGWGNMPELCTGIAGIKVDAEVGKISLRSVVNVYVLGGGGGE